MKLLHQSSTRGISRRLGAFLLAPALIFSSLFTPTIAYAEDGDQNSNNSDQGSDNSGQQAKPAVWLQISPVSNRVTLKPSGSEPLTYTFNVDNIGTEEFKYKIYAAPYSVANGSYEIDFSSETPRTQISRWITFQDKDGEYKKEVTYSIKPGEKQSIAYKITVPDNIPAGGQYATIFAEADSGKDNASLSTGIKTVSRVGLVVYGRTEGDTDDNAEIRDFKLSSFLTGGNINTSAVVENKGNTDFSTTYSLVVKKFFGDTAYEKTKTYDVLPDTYRDISIEWAKDEDDDSSTGTPAFGIFHVTSTVTALNEKHEETKLVLIIPFFMIIIAVVLLTIMIVWLIILIKKRRAQKSRLIV